MPLVRISLLEGQPKSQHTRIGDAVHRALVETISIPVQDRFQIITEHHAADFIFDPSYLDIARTNALVIIQITLNTGRSLELKRALYKRVAELLAKDAGLRKEDVLINLVEVAKENWSFGNGQAQYAT
jgi:4-oxalocrotonate tautomerase